METIIALAQNIQQQIDLASGTAMKSRAQLVPLEYSKPSHATEGYGRRVGINRGVRAAELLIIEDPEPAAGNHGRNVPASKADVSIRPEQWIG
jgi:hypothetical protein